MSDPREKLNAFVPRHALFVGIDSDGCVFDTMEIKQKECFIPSIIRVWGLQSISKYVREAAEFVNLYSRERGVNRWPALLKVFELVSERPEVQARRPNLPDLRPLREFIASGRPLDNKSLRELVDQTGDPVLQRALEWSLTVNRTVAEMVKDVPPFPYVRECLQRLQGQADMIVVSQTPTEALEREWQEHGIDRYVGLICGQEMGTKAEHLQLATRGRYQPHKMLMIGDAPGDLKAARAAGTRFFPVNPGDEEASWRRLHDQALERFLSGSYTEAYEQELIAAFLARMPETPPWKRAR